MIGLLLLLPTVAAFNSPTTSSDDQSICIAPGPALFTSVPLPTCSVEPPLPPEPPAPLDDDSPVVTTRADSVPLSHRTFMPFEQWKEYMLSQPNNERDATVDLEQPSRTSDNIRHSTEASRAKLDIEPTPDSDAHAHDINTGSSVNATDPTVSPNDELRLNYHPSKDAGKTCKERFSYSSFDAGATVLKTTSGAKNAKAILRENKDSYMLMECGMKNKFVIVELSDDILVDTVVIANFEFFSSMVRRFKVSASDRYPVKLDKWVDLGTFEARNSRDIQAFLVENPRIYARYIRIEFVTHYGNEFYCPISLIRVHGTTMIGSWREAEGTSEETLALEEAPDLEETEYPAIPAEPVATPTISVISDGHQMSDSKFAATGTEVVTEKAPRETASQVDTVHEGNRASVSVTPEVSLNMRLPALLFQSDISTCSSTETLAEFHAGAASIVVESQQTKITEAGTSLSKTKSQTHATPVDIQGSGAIPADENGLPQFESTFTSVAPSRGTNATTSRSKGSNPGPTPIVQESFFKSVSKRLQYLETNMTWSIRYLEDQVDVFRGVVNKMEGDHNAKAHSLLTHLNETILSELRVLRSQHEQMWAFASRMIEAQRERSDNEMLEMGARLNVLAEEVVFQKRMSIGQSILLLSCLVLVVFSRSAVAPPVDWGYNQREPLQRARIRRSRLGGTARQERHTESMELWSEDSIESDIDDMRRPKHRGNSRLSPPSTS